MFWTRNISLSHHCIECITKGLSTGIPQETVCEKRESQRRGSIETDLSRPVCHGTTAVSFREQGEVLRDKAEHIGGLRLEAGAPFILYKHSPSELHPQAMAESYIFTLAQVDIQTHQWLHKNSHMDNKI